MTHRPGHGITVAGWFTQPSAADARTLLEAEAEGVTVLAGYVREHALRAASRAAAPAR